MRRLPVDNSDGGVGDCCPEGLEFRDGLRTSSCLLFRSPTACRWTEQSALPPPHSQRDPPQHHRPAWLQEENVVGRKSSQLVCCDEIKALLNVIQ